MVTNLRVLKPAVDKIRHLLHAAQSEPTEP